MVKVIVINSEQIEVGDGNPRLNYEKNSSGIPKSVLAIRNLFADNQSLKRFGNGNCRINSEII